MNEIDKQVASLILILLKRLEGENDRAASEGCEGSGLWRKVDGEYYMQRLYQNEPQFRGAVSINCKGCLGGYCPDCSEQLNRKGSAYFCPRCKDYKLRPGSGCKFAYKEEKP